MINIQGYRTLPPASQEINSQASLVPWATPSYLLSGWQDQQGATSHLLLVMPNRMGVATSSTEEGCLIYKKAGRHNSRSRPLLPDCGSLRAMYTASEAPCRRQQVPLEGSRSLVLRDHPCPPPMCQPTTCRTLSSWSSPSLGGT